MTEQLLERLRNLLAGYQGLLAQEAAEIERIKARQAMLATERVFASCTRGEMNRDEYLRRFIAGFCAYAPDEAEPMYHAERSWEMTCTFDPEVDVVAYFRSAE